MLAVGERQVGGRLEEGGGANRGRYVTARMYVLTEEKNFDRDTTIKK